MSTTHEHTIDTMQLEERRYPPPADFAAQANAQADVYEQDFERFWDEQGRGRVSWFEDYSELYQWQPPYAKWYLGGRLNACFNCVDRHVEGGLGDRAAFHWEGEPEGDRRTITYAELQRDVVRWANALKLLGVEKGNGGRDLHGHGAGAAGGDAGLRAAGSAAHGGVRRLLGGLAVGPHERHAVHAC